MKYTICYILGIIFLLYRLSFSIPTGTVINPSPIPLDSLQAEDYCLFFQIGVVRSQQLYDMSFKKSQFVLEELKKRNRKLNKKFHITSNL